MKKVCTPVAVAAAVLVCAPGATAAAPHDERAAAAIAARMDVGTASAGQLLHARRQRAIRKNVRLVRGIARLKDERVTRRERARVRSRPLGVLLTRAPRLRDRLERLERHERQERRERRARRLAAQQAAAAAAPSASPALESIAACESGGNPAAVGGGGLYRGKYQFDQQTWESVGGSGDPAAASEAEQDARAAALYAQRGSAAWPSCGG